MKKYLIILLLITNVNLFSQIKNDTIPFTKTLTTINIDFNKNKQRFIFNQLDFYTNNDFSVFNRATMLNDNFSVYKGHYEYKNSVLIPENMFFNSKIDSFNPNGVSDFGSALLTGALNLTLSLFNIK
jgi:hypothetical protein